MMENIKERIIDIYNDNDRWIFVRVEELRDFLKNKLNINLQKGCKKAELVEIAKQILSPETLVEFCQMDRFGLASKDVKDVLGISANKAKSLIDENKIRIISIFQYKTNYVTSNICSIPDIIEISKSIRPTTRKKKKVERADINITTDHLAEAVYIINKSAKKSRDTKMDAYCCGDYRVCNAAKTRGMNLYHLKDAAMDKMQKDGILEYVGIHKQIIDDNTIYLDLYQCGTFTYHRPHKGVVNDSEILDSVINQHISAEVTKKVDMKYLDAIHLLENYTGEKATGTFNKSRWI